MKLRNEAIFSVCSTGTVLTFVWDYSSVEDNLPVADAGAITATVTSLEVQL